MRHSRKYFSDWSLGDFLGLKIVSHPGTIFPRSFPVHAARNGFPFVFLVPGRKYHESATTIRQISQNRCHAYRTWTSLLEHSEDLAVWGLIPWNNESALDFLDRLPQATIAYFSGSLIPGELNWLFQCCGRGRQGVVLVEM